MSALKNNLMFEYLYRDPGNYKTFGQIIFTNKENVRIEEATLIIVNRLIDKEYFYPLDAGVPILCEDNFNPETDWYEFIKFSHTPAKINDTRDVRTFLSNFETY